MHHIQRKNLSDQQLAEVKSWLQQHNINLQRLRRDFSDVLPLAEILKHSFPRLIDLNNYPKKHSVQLKLNNWETFNYKVLSKFNMTLSRQLMELLAAGVPGAVEVLLHDIIRLERRHRLEEQRGEALRQEHNWAENDAVKTIIINKQLGDGIVQVPQKMILFSLYEGVLHESQGKDVVIQAYQQRMSHMENIININRERINELLIQMNKMPLKTVTNPCSKCRSPNLSLIFNAKVPPAPAPSDVTLALGGTEFEENRFI